MMPDRKFLDYLRRKEPHQFGLFITMIRVGASLVIFIALLSAADELATFRSKWRFDGPNSYPLSNFLLYELSAALGALVAVRLWILSLRKY